mgnify:CR=1 FL=1
MATTVDKFLNPKLTISLSDIVQKGKTRLANISDNKGNPIKIVLAKDCSLRTPWNVSSFDGGARCTLDIIMNDQLEKLVNKVDDAVLAWVKANPERYFKNPPKDLTEWYKSLRKEAAKEGYANTLRCKCTMGENKASFKCWDADRNLMTYDEIRNIDWPESVLACEVALRGVYFQSNTFGPMLEVVSAMVKKEDDACPFEEVADRSDE